ncbi:MAG: DegT/DnrJ/EryC1/StrS family aminotransferase [Hydrogenothermaceae bacterium]|nr:DegT/DnrJ/EryC1/StrS family aminotransferase [Hydrogenothermaceae bacterium]
MKNTVIDINILLDYYENIRREKYPESVDVFEFLKNKDFAFVSVSSIDNLEFIKYHDLSVRYPNLTKNQKLKIVHNMIKEILSFFKIAKTPSYIEIDYEDIEDSLIIHTAKAIDGIVLTRDNKLLKKYPDICKSPKDYLESFKNKKTDFIPMLDLARETYYMHYGIEKNIDKVINKSNFILGVEVKELEQKIANYIGTEYAVGVSSGTDALLLSLRALAIKKKNQEYWSRGDLIITTPFTFTATGDTILRSGATPLFVDVDIYTYNIDVNRIKEAIKVYGKRVVGIVPVHLYGLPCNMDEVMAIAKENDLFVVEDCAQAFGSMYKGKKVGSFGDAGAFSFFPTKNLGAFGDAGAVTTNDKELFELIKMLRVHGGKDKYNVEHIGYKARIDTIQAAVLLEKIKYIDEFNQRRRKIAEYYIRGLSEVKDLKLPYIPSEDYYHTFHQFTIFVKNNKRDELQKSLKENNIQSMVYYPTPLHKMKVFEGRCEVFGSLENSEKASEGVLSLPIEPLMEQEELKFIVEKIKNMDEYIY